MQFLLFPNYVSAYIEQGHGASLSLASLAVNLEKPLLNVLLIRKQLRLLENNMRMKGNSSDHLGRNIKS